MGVLLLALMLLWPASRLRLLTDLPALLPDGAVEAEDYRQFLRRFGGFERVYVLLEGPAGVDSRETLLSASETLSACLAEIPEVASVRGGLDEEERDFFLRQVVRRGPLLIEPEDLPELRRRLEPEGLRRRAAELRSSVHSPTGGLTLEVARHDPLGLWDLSAGRMGLGAAGGLPLDPVTSSFVSHDGEVALLMLTPRVGEIDAAGGRRLAAALDAAFADLSRSFPTLKPSAVGGPLYAAQDEARIRSDMERTITGSVIACTVILLLAFGGPALPLLTLLVLAVALIVTAASLALGLGAVTGVGVGFAAVLIGLGVDFGIHGCARYRDRRVQGDDAEQALDATWRHVGPAILTAAMSTAGAFAVLGAAHFRPLRELGILVSVGIVAILLVFATLGSALISWFGSPRVGAAKVGAGDRFHRLLEGFSGTCIQTAGQRPRTVLGVAGLLSLAAVWGLAGLRLDPDLRALRPLDHPAFAAEAVLVERLGLGLGTATVVLPGRDLDEALARSAAVAEALRSGAAGVEPDALVVTAPSDFLAAPSQVAGRLSQLRELDLGAAVATLEREMQRANLRPDAFRSGFDALRSFAAGRDTERPAPEQWPEIFDGLVRVDEDGAAWVALRLRLGADAGGPSEAWIDDLRRRVPGSAVASAVRLGGAMKELAARDFAQLSWAAGLMVLLVVGISFQGRIRPSALSLVPVALGSLWTLGLWGGLGRPLDLLSLAVLPILLGIGIDDGLHAVHGAFDRHRSIPDGLRALGPSVRQCGAAVTLTTLTTCAGFGSLAGSSIPGLSNGGMLVAGGVVLCLLATLFVLPALGALAEHGPDMAEKDSVDL